MASVSGSSIVTVEPRPFSLVSADGAVQLLHVSLDHVHSHAATGEIADVFLGGEARLEDQHAQLFVAQLRVGADQSALDRLAANCSRIDSRAIVG